MSAPTFTHVPAAELRAGQIVQWAGNQFHGPDIGTVRTVAPSGWAGGDWTRVTFCGPMEWLECSGRHRLTVVNVD